MKEKEIWKTIPGYKDYQVSNLGRVKSLKFGKERLRKLGKSKGYLFLNLWEDGKRKPFRLHSLLAMTFLDHIPNGHDLIIDHINGDILDNRLENLRIVTPRENTTFGMIKKETSSKYTGVNWVKHANKWRAQIQINKKPVRLGYFNTEEEASEAYQKELKKLNG